MSATPFSWGSEALERATFMNLAQCRGTLRLALKKAGLDPATLTAPELTVVLRKVLPVELEVRGVESADLICREIEAGLSEASFQPPTGTTHRSTDSTLRRIFG